MTPTVTTETSGRAPNWVVMRIVAGAGVELSVTKTRRRSVPAWAVGSRSGMKRGSTQVASVTVAWAGPSPLIVKDFFLGHLALGSEQGGGIHSPGLRDVDDQPHGDGLIGRVVGGDADGLFLPARASADGEFDAHRAGLTGGERLLADRGGEAIEVGGREAKSNG